MRWFFLAFFGVIAVCAVISIVTAVRDRLAPKTVCDAVVEKRYAANFPMTMGFVKRDRKERHLVFAPESGGTVDLAANDELYKRCPVGTRGRLVYQGGRLVSFDPAATPDGDNADA